MYFGHDDLKVLKAFTKPIRQNGANDVFGGIMSRINEVDPLGARIQETVIFNIGGHKGIAPLRQGIADHIGTGATSDRHNTDRLPYIYIANTV